MSWTTNDTMFDLGYEFEEAREAGHTRWALRCLWHAVTTSILPGHWRAFAAGRAECIYKRSLPWNV